MNCEKNGERVCDYSIRLNWEGRSKRKANDLTPEPQDQGPSVKGGQMQMLSFQPPISGPPRTAKAEPRSPMIDPALILAELPTSARDFSAQFARPQKFPGSRPSSAGSQASSPAPSSGPGSAGLQQGQMLPPFATISRARSDTPSGIEHRDKRARPSPTSQPQMGTNSPEYLSPHNFISSTPSVPDSHLQSSKQGPTSAPDLYKSAAFPLTPSNSSVTSEDVYAGVQPKGSSPLPLAYNDPRRLSVNSLLTQEAEAKASGESLDSKGQFVTYGTDRGLPDLDIPRNDDVGVIDVVTPVLTNYRFHDGMGDLSTEFGFGLYASNDEEKANGYAEPISVNIPTSLEPLPPLLLENKMNLMYFHFFLEFTARILVPHDCPENPFKFILPQSKSHATDEFATS